MEGQQVEEGGGNCSGKEGFLCRQSSTRWTPTADQIRILKELYYNNGVRSPSAEQIQRISAKLRQFGKIEGKNVFYWFQNHKARERQKKRFTATSAEINPSSVNLTNAAAAISSGVWKNSANNVIAHGGNFPNSSAFSPGLVAAGSYGYGPVAMENSFREWSITRNGGGSMNQNFTWVGIEPYSNSAVHYNPNFLDMNVDRQTLGSEYEQEEQRETLPLFPMHNDNTSRQESSFCYDGWQRRQYSDESLAGSRASLELTLNSYAATFP